MRTSIIASLLAHGLSLFTALMLAPEDLRGANWVLLYGCTTLVIAALFSQPRSSAKAGLGWCTLIAVPFFFISQFNPGTAGPDFSALLLTAIALALASWCASELKTLCAAEGAPASGGAQTCLWLLVLITTPVWLGPLAQSSYGSELLTDITLASSPATFLAVALDTDYLRSDWLYRHSAFGSLRYQFTPLWQLFIGYGLLGIALTLIRWRLQTTSKLNNANLETGTRQS